MDNAMIRFPCVNAKSAPLAVAVDHYGLSFEADVSLKTQFERWAKRYRAGGPTVLSETTFDRFALEEYFVFASVIPMKWAAARLGMASESLRVTLANLEENALAAWRHQGLSEHLVPIQVISDMHTYFPAIQRRTFSSHSDKCRRLHQVIRDEFKIDVVALLDPVSTVLKGEESADFAEHFDILTDAPLGLRHQVWLNLGKPLFLKPDACSIMTYARHQDALAPHLMTSRPPFVPEAIAELVQKERAS